ncbi:proliferating cell nuclear antigen, partial [Quaeritorhiza haematococci]
MFEARLSEAAVLKKVLDAVKELVTDANFDCNENGIALQAMDNAHVALVALLLKCDAFDPFRCDRNLSLGINLNSLTKIVKTAGNDDVVTVKADDNVDTLTITFENGSNDRISEYELKLMDIDQEHLGIPDTEYDAIVKMSSAEFQRICRDLVILGESVTIDVTKDGVKMSAAGDLGSGSVTLKPGGAVDGKEEEALSIILNNPVSLTFSLKYLVNFTKATPLSDVVHLNMSSESPLLVEYTVKDIGHI